MLNYLSIFLFMTTILSRLVAAISVLSVITAYRSQNNPLVRTILANYQSICRNGYRVTVVLLTVDEWKEAALSDLLGQFFCRHQLGDLTLPSMHIEVETFHPEIGINLAVQSRKTIRKYLDSYDIFISQEDDIDFTIRHLDYFIRNTAILESLSAESSTASSTRGRKDALSHEDTSMLDDSVIGFLRYEIMAYDEDMNNIIANKEDEKSSSEYLHVNTGGLFEGLEGRTAADYAASSERYCNIRSDEEVETSTRPLPNYRQYIGETPLPVFYPVCIGRGGDDDKNYTSSGSSYHRHGYPYISDEVNPHQGLWVLTKMQIKALERRCNFLRQDETMLEDTIRIREYMSSFSIYKTFPAVLRANGIPLNASCGVRKIIPPLELFDAAVHHLRQGSYAYHLDYEHRLPIDGILWEMWGLHNNGEEDRNHPAEEEEEIRIEEEQEKDVRNDDCWVKFVKETPWKQVELLLQKTAWQRQERLYDDMKRSSVKMEIGLAGDDDDGGGGISEEYRYRVLQFSCSDPSPTDVADAFCIENKLSQAFCRVLHEHLMMKRERQCLPMSS